MDKGLLGDPRLAALCLAMAVSCAATVRTGFRSGAQPSRGDALDSSSGRPGPDLPHDALDTQELGAARLLMH